MDMPLKAELHADGCPAAKDGHCTCDPTPLLLTGRPTPEEAAAIHGGQAGRLKFVCIVPPPVDWDRKRMAPGRSQADRHRAISD
jgi:hypothetical protein